MERKSIWKNFLLLTIGSLIVFNVNLAMADGNTSPPNSSGSEEGCVLEND